MESALRAAISSGLQEIAHSMGMWLSETTSGTTRANQQLAAEYLIELFDAGGDGFTVTDRLLSGLLQYKAQHV